jgi:hypothetical protein
MQAPAAVSRDGRDGGAWRTAGALLHGLALASLLAWAVAPAAALAALPVVAVMALRRPAATTPRLAWDGRVWQLDGAEARPQIALDLGGWMLLRVRADRRTHWLPMSPAAAPDTWPALRAALYGTARPAA